MANLSDIITPTNVVTATSTTTMTNKTLVAPALGTPASGVMTSVTGLPLATGVTGTLPAANGGTGVTAAGASGNVLTSNGSTWASTAPVSSAGLVHISTVTASNVSSAEFTTSLSSYESFIVVCTAFYPATNSADILFRFNTNSSNYTGIMGGVNDSGASYAIERGTEMVLSYNQNSTAANADLTSAQINIFGNASGEYKNVVGIAGYRSSNYGQMSMNISGGWRDTAALTSIKFYPSAGNFYGKFMLYGVTTS